MLLHEYIVEFSHNYSVVMVDRERALSGDGIVGARARSGSVINRIVLVAVDSSDNAKTAFNCEFVAVLIF